MENQGKKAVVALSGGLDSSVAALLLKQQGYEVIGLTGRMVDTPAADIVVQNAKAVAESLDIEHHVFDASEIFKQKVIDYFVKEYQLGHTPNPCIACNRYVIWEALLQRSLEIGADYIATGH